MCNEAPNEKIVGGNIPGGTHPEKWRNFVEISLRFKMRPSWRLGVGKYIPTWIKLPEIRLFSGKYCVHNNHNNPLRDRHEGMTNSLDNY